METEDRQADEQSEWAKWREWMRDDDDESKRTEIRNEDWRLNAFHNCAKRICKFDIVGKRTGRKKITEWDIHT